MRQDGRRAALPATYVLDSNHQIVFSLVSVTPTERPTVEQILAALTAAD